MRVTVAVMMSILATACGDSRPAPAATGASTGPVAIVTMPKLAPGAELPAASLRVSVAKGAAQVQIRLPDLDRPAAELIAELEDRETGEIRRWSIEALPASEGGAMAVTVPAYAVSPGTHVLSVWAGDADLLRRYLFDVVER